MRQQEAGLEEAARKGVTMVEEVVPVFMLKQGIAEDANAEQKQEQGKMVGEPPRMALDSYLKIAEHQAYTRAGGGVGGVLQRREVSEASVGVGVGENICMQCEENSLKTLEKPLELAADCAYIVGMPDKWALGGVKN